MRQWRVWLCALLLVASGCRTLERTVESPPVQAVVYLAAYVGALVAVFTGNADYVGSPTGWQPAFDG